MGTHQKIIALALGVSITVSIGGVQKVWAAPNDLQQQIDQIHNQQAQHKQRINLDQSKLSKIQKQEADALNQINQLNSQITSAANQIQTTQDHINNTQAQVDRLKKSILATQKRVNKRKGLLEKRVRVMYKDGGSVQYLEVLLGAQNFSDFLDRAFALHLIASQDKHLLDAQLADKRKEEKSKVKIKKSLDKLQKELDSLSSLKSQLSDHIRTENALMDELKQKGGKLKSSIQAEQQAIQSVQAKVSGLIQQKQAAQQHQSANHIQQMSASVQHSTPTSSSNSNSVSSDPVQVTHHSSSSSSSSNSGSSSSSNSSTSNSASGSIAEMIRLSKQWIGNSVYEYGGGRTPAEIRNGIFDCSSFVHWAYAQIGVNVGWSTYQLKDEGIAVSPSDMRPGDLVFFDTDGPYGHVGIYIGHGEFIGAQSSTGVAIASMNNPYYWKPRFHGHVRRIIH